MPATFRKDFPQSVYTRIHFLFIPPTFPYLYFLSSVLFIYFSAVSTPGVGQRRGDDDEECQCIRSGSGEEVAVRGTTVPTEGAVKTRLRKCGERSGLFPLSNEHFLKRGLLRRRFGFEFLIDCSR